MNFQDNNLIEEFVAECQDHLENVDADLLELEKENENIDIDVINRLFRAVNSMKGSAGFFGFEALKELSHAMENILNLFREKKAIPDSIKIDALFKGLDKLKEMVSDIQNSNNINYSLELDLLKNALEAKVEMKPAVAAEVALQPKDISKDCEEHFQVLDKHFIGLQIDPDNHSINPSVLKDLLFTIENILDIAQKNHSEILVMLGSLVKTILEKCLLNN